MVKIRCTMRKDKHSKGRHRPGLSIKTETSLHYAVPLKNCPVIKYRARKKKASWRGKSDFC